MCHYILQNLAQFIKNKKSMKKNILLVALLSISSTFLFSQVTYNQLRKAGTEAYAEGNYFGAMQYIQEALDKEDSDTDMWYKYGNSAYKQFAYGEAKRAFNYLIEDLKSIKYSDAILSLADIYLTEGDNEQAEKYFSLYLSEYSEEGTAETERANLGLESAKWIAEQDTTVTTKINHMGTDVNSPYSEHSPVYQDGRLQFVSMKFGMNAKKDTREYSKILESKGGSAIEMESISNFNQDDIFSSDPSYTTDGSVMYYTQCVYEKSDIRCQIFYRKKQGETYGDGIQAGNLVNLPGTTNTHPTIVEHDGESVLYFVSNRDDGMGMLDIWYSTISENMEFGKPINLRSINTKGDDITPHFHNKTSTLYFSTNGRVGYGNFDVFMSKISGRHMYKEVENLGKNVNSSYNDIHYFLSETSSDSYLSSNRKGSLYLEDKFETCCYDIYQVNKCIVDLVALTFDKATKEQLFDAYVEITDKETGDIVETHFLDGTNKYEIELDCNKDYSIRASKEGYKDAILDLDFSKMDLDGDPFEQKIYLEPAVLALNVLTFDKDTRDALYGVNVQLVDVESGEVVERTNPNGNDFSFSIVPGKAYKLLATKGGYQKDEIIFTAPEEGGIISKEMYLEKTIIEKKIATLQGVLPVQLFFDNDIPNPKTMKTTTDATYTEKYPAYYDRKEKFANVYSGLFAGDKKVQSQSEARAFFDNEVKRGYDNFNLFLTTLEEVLISGRTINLYFRGYASPVAVSEYNFNLGRRRINTLLNDINRFNGGALRKYVDSGQLILTERSFGETTASKEVSDNPNDPRRSIFSPAASRERRVEIEEISVSGRNL